MRSTAGQSMANAAGGTLRWWRPVPLRCAAYAPPPDRDTRGPRSARNPCRGSRPERWRRAVRRSVRRRGAARAGPGRVKRVTGTRGRSDRAAARDRPCSSRRRRSRHRGLPAAHRFPRACHSLARRAVARLGRLGAPPRPAGRRAAPVARPRRIAPESFRRATATPPLARASRSTPAPRSERGPAAWSASRASSSPGCRRSGQIGTGWLLRGRRSPIAPATRGSRPCFRSSLATPP